MFKKNSFKITITSHIPSCLNGKNRSLNSKTLASDPYDVDDPVRNIVKPIKIVCIRMFRVDMETNVSKT